MQAKGQDPGFGRRTWIALRKLRFIQATLATLAGCNSQSSGQFSVFEEFQGQGAHFRQLTLKLLLRFFRRQCLNHIG